MTSWKKAHNKITEKIWLKDMYNTVVVLLTVLFKKKRTETKKLFKLKCLLKLKQKLNSKNKK